MARHELETRWPTPEENPFLEMQVATRPEVYRAIDLNIALPIAIDYKDVHPKPLFVTIQNGGAVLAERLKPTLTQLWGEEPEFVDIQISRTNGRNEFGDPQIIRELPAGIDLRGRKLIGVEDMIDGGLSLNEADRYLRDFVKASSDEENIEVDIEYAVVYERLGVDRPKDQVIPKYVAMQVASELWALGEGPDDKRILQPGMDVDTNLPLDGGRNWPGLWLNRPD